ncbi:Transcriptional regulator, LysR family protein [Minicystis rosea]|nr:Transcriptional regulator, LysR family protein [Minicystis rosea]
MLDLTRLRSFVALVDAGSFTAAAKALGLTKAAVSLHVRKLEDELGCALVVRSTRHATPTEAGAQLHAAGTALLAEAERVEAHAKQHVGLSGTVRLTSTNEYLSFVLAPIVASFLRAHPRVRLELFGAPALADIVAERFDVAVRFGNPPSSALRATKLTTFRLVPVATPALIARYGEPTHPSDLARLPWVLNRYHPNPSPWHRGEETCTVSLSSRLIGDATDANRRLALEGAGAMLSADWHAREDLRAGRFVRLLPDWSSLVVPVYAVRPPTAHVPAKVRALVQHLRDALA